MKRILWLFAMLPCFGVIAEIKSDRPNVLFITVDDLRPQLNCMGESYMKTPNIDRLATGGTAFSRAYCQAPQCGPTRASVLTGLRPSRQRFFRNDGRQPGGLEDGGTGVTTLPQLFKQNGYTTLSLGKVYHHHRSDPKGWSEKPWKVRPNAPDFHLIPETWQSAEGKAKLKKQGNRWRSISCEAADVDDDAYPDGQIAAKAMERLGQLKESGKPFFMAVGFLRPHLPFNAPQKYWDQYKPSEVNLADNPFRPKGAPDIAFHEWPELRNYPDIPKKGPLSDEKAKQLIHGYYACVSYTDAQVGKLLDQLDELGLSDNTIVVLWGDHGWNLGEHGLWCKHSLFETSLRAPLIVRAPGMKAGQLTNALVEFVDIYPTLANLCDFPSPSHLEGSSLKPLLADKNAPWKNAVFSRWQWGESVRTDHYRYSEWYDPQGETIDCMLYDERKDPAENKNIADSPESRDRVEKLSKILAQGKGWHAVQK